MKLSTGKVAFPIEFDNGQKDFIYFNPNDKGIDERIEAFQEAVNEKIKNINIDKYRETFEDGVDVNIDINDPESLIGLSVEQIESLKKKMGAIRGISSEYNNSVKEELDVVFNSKISDVAFRYCEPFDTVIIEDEQGNETRQFYIMHFMQWLMIELKKHGEQNKSAIDKHLAKYRK